MHPGVGGTLTIVVWEGYDDREALAPFYERYGVTIEPIYVDTDGANVSILAERRGSVDLVAIDHRFAPLLVDAELLVPIEYEGLASAKSYLERFVDLARLAGPGGPWSAPYIWGTAPLMYNAAHVASPPQSWRDIMRPEYRGRVVIVDEPVNQIVIWARVLGHEDPTTVTRRQLDEIVSFIARVKRTTDARVESWGELPRLLASGEAWISTGGWDAIRRFAAEQGADVRGAHPREGDHAWMDAWCLLGDAPNPETALAFVDWMIGVEAQRTVCENLICGTVNRDAIELIDPATRALFPYDNLDDAFRNGGDYALPPLERTDDVATLDDWTSAWERVRSG